MVKQQADSSRGPHAQNEIQTFRKSQAAQRDRKRCLCAQDMQPMKQNAPWTQVVEHNDRVRLKNLFFM